MKLRHFGGAQSINGHGTKECMIEFCRPAERIVLIYMHIHIIMLYTCTVVHVYTCIHVQWCMYIHVYMYTCTVVHVYMYSVCTRKCDNNYQVM